MSKRILINLICKLKALRDFSLVVFERFPRWKKVFVGHTNIFQLHSLAGVCRSFSEFLHILFFWIFVVD
nr:MAG TPA: hypothetical protein [Caudoviricetes sp.]